MADGKKPRKPRAPKPETPEAAPPVEAVPETPRERGRPSDFTREIALTLCAKLATGRTLRDVCRDEGMPHESTVRKWALENREGFHTQYTQARELGYLSMADETLEISDDGSNDWMKRKQGEDMIDVPNPEVIARSRLRVDTRKWLLSKALPKMFGDRVIHAGDEENPVVTKEVGERELARRIAFALQRGASGNSGADKG